MMHDALHLLPCPGHLHISRGGVYATLSIVVEGMAFPNTFSLTAESFGCSKPPRWHMTSSLSSPPSDGDSSIVIQPAGRRRRGRSLTGRMVSSLFETHRTRRT